MQIFSYLISGVILTFIDYFLCKKNSRVKSIILNLLNYIIFFNIVSLGIIKFIIKDYSILNSNYYNASHSLKYILFTVVLGLIFICIKWIILKKFTIKKSIPKHKKLNIIIKLIYIVLVVIGLFFISFSNWFINYFGNITPEQFLFNLSSPLKGTSNEIYVEVLHTPIFFVISFTIIFIAFIFINKDIISKNKNTSLFNQKTLKIIGAFISLVIFIGGVGYGVNKLQLRKVYKAYVFDSTYIKDHYVDPRNVKMTFPKQKRNLIHIYLESIENSYLSKELGGYMDVNLMPELTTLSKKGVSFSHNNKYGGPYQTYGSGWSVASMVNMGAGIPLKVAMNGNSYGKSGSFLPGAITVGDILEAEGYNQTVMFGADADFGGLTTYFKTHGNFNILDHKGAIKKGLIPSNYSVWWGYEDDKLYPFAEQELTRLYKEGKPFNLTMETADTHFPDGYMSKHAKKKYKSQYANVIAYSTKETVRFVKWIQKQPFYKNTTIVITGDHWSMDKKFFKGWNPNYRRSIFNLILNPDPKTTNKHWDRLHNRAYAPFDMFPTILASLGVQIQGNKLGLGTNLFAKQKTLIEQDGIDVVNERLGEKSNFFNDKIISEKQNSVFNTKNVSTRK